MLLNLIDPLVLSEVGDGFFFFTEALSSRRRHINADP